MNEKEHKEQMNRVEEKFFEEKMRLQREANKKIDELAEKAHEAAIKLTLILCIIFKVTILKFSLICGK